MVLPSFRVTFPAELLVTRPSLTAGLLAHERTHSSLPSGRYGIVVRVPRSITAVLPGLGLALAIGAVATAIGSALPLLGGPVAGVLLGLLTTVLFHPLQRSDRFGTGVKFAGSRLLQTAVVLLGAQVSLTQVLAVGWSSLPVMLGTLAACLLAAWGLGRAMRIDSDLTALIGVGTAICGASAIAAITPVLKPAATKIAYALSTVFVFNIAAVLLFPWLGHVIGMEETVFGVFAGTAVNDTSSVVAAATVYGPIATDTAVVVKLARTLMIIPIAVGLALLVSRRSAPAGSPHEAGSARPPIGKLVPWFLVGFILLAALHPLLPDAATNAGATLAVFLITVALSAIGLSVDLAGIVRTGIRPLVLGATLWLVVSGTSLLIQGATTGLAAG